MWSNEKGRSLVGARKKEIRAHVKCNSLCNLKNNVLYCLKLLDLKRLEYTKSTLAFRRCRICPI